MSKRNTTFVTCCVQIYSNDAFPDRSMSWRINHFKQIANTQINICVYACPLMIRQLTDEFQYYKNVIIRPANLSQCFLYNECMTASRSSKLPANRHITKDTIDYIALMHAKMDFMAATIIDDPFYPYNEQMSIMNTNYAWFDFSMAYLFNDTAVGCAKIVAESNALRPEHFFYIPGCWDALAPEATGPILNQIHWRFCGSFFIADGPSLMQFYNIYRRELSAFIQYTKYIVWEVNFWAWLEANTSWTPTWYVADHNERLLDIPATV